MRMEVPGRHFWFGQELVGWFVVGGGRIGPAMLPTQGFAYLIQRSTQIKST
jgi:hypothetical protein